MDRHTTIHENGDIVPIRMGATTERLYEKLLEDPFRVISVEELAKHINCPFNSLGMQIKILRQRLEEAGIVNVVFNHHSQGYSLRKH